MSCLVVLDLLGSAALGFTNGPHGLGHLVGIQNGHAVLIARGTPMV